MFVGYDDNVTGGLWSLANFDQFHKNYEARVPGATRSDLERRVNKIVLNLGVIDSPPLYQGISEPIFPDPNCLLNAPQYGSPRTVDQSRCLAIMPKSWSFDVDAAYAGYPTSDYTIDEIGVLTQSLAVASQKYPVIRADGTIAPIRSLNITDLYKKILPYQGNDVFSVTLRAKHPNIFTRIKLGTVEFFGCRVLTGS